MPRFLVQILVTYSDLVIMTFAALVAQILHSDGDSWLVAVLEEGFASVQHQRVQGLHSCH